MNDEIEQINKISNNIDNDIGDIQYLIYTFIPTICSYLESIEKNVSQIENQVVTDNPVENFLLKEWGRPVIGSLMTITTDFIGAIGGLASAVGGIIAFETFLKSVLNKTKCRCNCCGGTGGGGGGSDGDGDDSENDGKTSELSNEDPRLSKIIDNFGMFYVTIELLEKALPTLSQKFSQSLGKMSDTAKSTTPKIGEELSAPLVKSCSTIEVALAKLNKDSKVQLNGIGNNITSENKKILASNTLLNKDLLNNTIKSNKELIKEYNSYYSKLNKDLNVQSNTIVATMSKEDKKILAQNTLLNKELLSNTTKSNKELLEEYNSYYLKLILEASKNLPKVVLPYETLENSINIEVITGGKKINESNVNSLNTYYENTKSYLGKVHLAWSTNTSSIDGIVSKSGKKISGETSSTMHLTHREISNGLAAMAALMSPFGSKINGHVNSIGEKSRSSVHSSLNGISSSMNVFNGKTLGTVNGLGKGIASSISASTPSWSSAFNGGLKGMENDAISWGNRMERYFEGFSSRVGSIIRGIGADLSQAKTDLTQGNNIEDKMQQDMNLSNGGLGDMTFDGAFLAVPSESTWDHSRLRKISGSSMFGGNADGAVNVVINSPKALNPFEVRRQLEQTSRNMANGFY